MPTGSGNINNQTSAYEDFSLTDAEQDALLRVAASANRVESVNGFEAWIRSDVAVFFPHAMMLCAVGSITGLKIHIEKVLGIGYPKAFLDNLGYTTNLLERPVLRRWLEQNKPQLIDEAQIDDLLSPFEQEEVKVFDLINIAAYGVLDLSVGRGTYFSFSRIPGPLSARHGTLLEMVVPYLHHALVRVVHTSPPFVERISTQLNLLTPKEQEILSLLGAGLSNREIALKLDRSELTVQTHVHSVLKKLNVTSRSGAIALMRGVPPNSILVKDVSSPMK